MLGLLQPTDPAWVDAAAADLPGLLSDHAHCELKAAQSALSMLARHGGEAPQLVEPLGALAREESQHFLEVQRRLGARGGSLGEPRKDDYVVALQRAAKQNRHDGHPVLLDRLLVCALIEGRSCERFRLLSEGLADAGLRSFYEALMASEARHFTLFSSLAGEIFGMDDTRARFATLARREAGIAHRLPLGPTVHG
ncbi:MAG: tRNA-(ms[2]io[6]A)-hydroxylase [Myxococcales bacterium]|jgi:tRNA-(ms[2]io[6]A)-hydroxylase